MREIPSFEFLFNSRTNELGMMNKELWQGSADLYKDPIEQFRITLESMGGKLQIIKGLDAVKEIL